MSCAPTKRCPVFQSKHLLVPKQHHFSNIRMATFLPNLGDRPRILLFLNPKRKNPGTIAKIRPKVACDIFEILVSEKIFRILFSNFLFKIFLELFLICRHAAAASLLLRAAAAAPPRRGHGAAAPAGTQGRSQLYSNVVKGKEP